MTLPPPVAAKKPDAKAPRVVVRSEDNIRVLPVIEPDDRKKKKGGKISVGRVLSWVGKLKWRHAIIAASFSVIVAVPVVVSSLYLFCIANDQYASSASFSLRSIESSSTSDVLGMFMQAGSGSTVSDSYVLVDYILSESMVAAVDKEFGLVNIYGRRGLDFFYALGPNLPIEDKVDYWKSIVNVNFDHTSGIIVLQVKAFEAETAQRVAAFVLSRSEELVNDLSYKAREEVLRTSKEEVQLAETRLLKVRLSMKSYRGSTQEANPIESAKLATEIVAKLDQQLVELNTDLTTAQSQMGDDSPRVRVIKSRIASLRKQIEQERQRFGNGEVKTGGTSPESSVADRIYEYEALETEREFAERAYTSALAGLEKARIEAGSQQRYLATFIQPTLSEYAQYPARLLNVVLILLGGLFVWGVLVMGYYNIRDRN